MADLTTRSEDQMRGIGAPRHPGTSPSAENSARSILLEELAALQGTVTGLLERLVQEPIDAHVLRSMSGVAVGWDPSATSEGNHTIRRLASLTGRNSLRPYVQAATVIEANWIPRELCQQLEESNEPIGRVLSGVCVSDNRRHVADDPIRPDISEWVGEGTDTRCLYSRSYLIEVAGQDVMSISEWFLPSLIIPLLDSRP